MSRATASYHNALAKNLAQVQQVPIGCYNNPTDTLFYALPRVTRPQYSTAAPQTDLFASSSSFVQEGDKEWEQCAPQTSREKSFLDQRRWEYVITVENVAAQRQLEVSIILSILV